MPVVTVPETGFILPAYRSPASAGRSAVPHGATAFLGLTYGMPPGYRELGIDVYVPSERSGPVPCVIWIHGGAWLTGHRGYFPDLWPHDIVLSTLIERGYAVATIDYRHAREASFPAQLHDAKAAVRYLRHFADEFGIDENRIAAWGESAGGHLAALLGLVDGRPDLEGTIGVPGADSGVAAVVDWYGVSDVTTMPKLGEAFAQDGADPGAPTEEPIDIALSGVVDRIAAEFDFSPVNHASIVAPPFLIAHGEDDGLVPFSQGEQLRDRLLAVGAPVIFRAVPGADHVWIGVDMQPLVTEAVDFLDSVLRR